MLRRNWIVAALSYVMMLGVCVLLLLWNAITLLGSYLQQHRIDEML